jgi:DNA-binding NarL/FixJ family response regulator
MVKRVVVCDPLQDECGESCAPLQSGTLQLETCVDGEHLLEAVIGNAPDAIVYCMRSDIDADLAVLHLLRRILPDAPLILLAREGSLATQRAVQALRPVYYMVAPVDAEELREAVESVVGRRRHTAGA